MEPGDQKDSEPPVRSERRNGVAYVVLSRPAKRNALDTRTRTALMQEMAELEEDDEARVIVLSGSGKSFAAGADLAEMARRTTEEQRAFIEPPHMYDAVASSSKPVIACVNGHALGAGCELMMACDLRIAGDRAKVGQPEILLGLIPGGGGTQRLPRLVGLGQALRLVLTGEVITADEAQKVGLVEEVVPQSELYGRVTAVAEKMALLSPTALRHAKQAVRQAAEVPLADGLAQEIDRFTSVFASDDAKEGINAFLEGREPRFGARQAR